ncbi:MAG: hypothetical protein RQ826_07750 [Xanthomonadales bacterium]|nr:hypothetical protein [Xanthomonadales bacterium]
MSSHKGTRRLLVFTVVMLISGFAASALFWTIGPSPAFLSVQENYSAAITAAAGAEKGAASAVAGQQWDAVSRAARAVEAHGHLLFLCIFLLLFTVLLHGLEVREQTEQRVAWLGISGVLIYPAGLILQASGYILAGQVFSAFGALLILAFAGLIVAGLWGPRTGPQPDGNDR